MKSILKKHFILISILITAVALAHAFGITCVWKSIFKIPCPTCGMTRAMLSLLRLDYAGYLSYNPMALPVTLGAAVLLHSRVIKRYIIGKGAIIASGAVLLINMCVYICSFF